MTTLSAAQWLGNAAVSYVAAQLSAQGCLVRPVAEGTDLGIDLFCETTIASATKARRTPFLHFFLQVKAGRQCRMLANGACACRVTTKHVQYWDRQPVPVFIAMVPSPLPWNRPGAIYIADLTDTLQGPRAKNSRRTMLLRSTRVLGPDDSSAVRDFLDSDVAAASALLAREHGVVAPDPLLERAYVRTFEALFSKPISPWRRRIQYQLRSTIAMTAMIAWHHGELMRGDLREDETLLFTLLDALARFESQDGNKRRGLHWEVFFSLGLCLHNRRQFDEARRAYDIATRTIRDDRRLQPLNNAWKERLLHIRRCSIAAKAKRALQRPQALVIR